MPDKKYTVKRNNKEIVATVNLQQVKKGVKQNNNQVVGETIYDVSKTKHSNWLVIALETGQRGWYPGKNNN